MTEQEFHDKVVAFMARIDETLMNLPCRGKEGCTVEATNKVDYKKWLYFGIGFGAGLAGFGSALIKLLGIPV